MNEIHTASESIHERCSCGAQLRLEGSAETIRNISEAWRRDHWHTESDGICGAEAPVPSGETRTDHCTLRARHNGWHHGSQGVDWTFGATPEAQA